MAPSVAPPGEGYFLEDCLAVADAQSSQRLPILHDAKELRSGHACTMCVHVFGFQFFFLSGICSPPATLAAPIADLLKAAEHGLRTLPTRG